MTPAQNAMYFAEFGKLRDVLRARGKSHAEIEAHRGTITVKALGHHKSSTKFTNADLDKVIAEIKAQTSPDDFEAQMRIQDSPEKRFELLLGRVESLSRNLGLTAGNETGYVDGIARRMFGKQYHDLDERSLQQIEGVLRKRLRQLHVTAERIDAIEHEAAEAAAQRVAIVTGTVRVPAATKQLVAGEDF